MNRKASLYAVIGGVVGAVLTMAVCSVLPLGAQNGDATFGKITCTKLNVVDAEGNIGVSLDNQGYYGGNVFVWGEDGGMCGCTTRNAAGVLSYGGTASKGA